MVFVQLRLYGLKKVRKNLKKVLTRGRVLSIIGTLNYGVK